MAYRSLPSITSRALLDLGTIRTIDYRRAEVIFSAGDASDSVMYIQRGGVKVSVVSGSGREAVLAVLGPGDFLGEGCLAGQLARVGSASAMTPATIDVVAKDVMLRLLRSRPVSDRLLSHVLVRSMSLHEDLIAQLFSSTETRLARTLLLLARYGTRDRPRRVLGSVSEDALARIVGTTRPRISALMNKFERAGFIENNGTLAVNPSLLSVVLHD
jgi:CRP-like cAMP-binding protein